MKFSEFSYKRPDINELEQKFNTLISEFEMSSSPEAQNDIIGKINELRNDFNTMSTIASIRYTVDTEDKFNSDEQDYFDAITPVYEGMINRYYEAITRSKFKSNLEKKWGKQLFDIAEQAIKTFKPEILEDLIKENELNTEYSKFFAQALLQFDGKELNLSQLGPYLESPERNIRREANEAKWKYLSDNAEKLDRIYDELVKIRHKMALKLGYKNFVEMGYDRMGRTDYNPEMVAGFRKQVLENIVPITLRLKEKQKERLGLDEMYYYDSPLDYKDGNAKPDSDANVIMSCAANMYKELSPQTNEFFKHMVEDEMMDLVAKKGKETGGYCTFINNYKTPFIFSNFNGTMGDVEVLTHEAGHAFQAWSSRNFAIPEYYFPTSEACEIHSMSMEYLTWPWMKCFFKERTDKFKYSHLKGSMQFVPYGVAVDEFQHYVYENPEATPAERKKMWREIENKYQPYLNYAGNEYLENGGRWQFQRHIYQSPFYYIDYCLAQMCAFQFWIRNYNGDENTLNDYLKLCEAGGSKSFLDLVKLANLKSPFEPDSVKSIVNTIDKWLVDIEKKMN